MSAANPRRAIEILAALGLILALAAGGWTKELVIERRVVRGTATGRQAPSALHTCNDRIAPRWARDTFPVGQVIDSVVSRSDPTQSYALYLPSRYDTAHRWPVLYLMDPRGRALVPMELFREPAERHGWIVFSSYNTLSDGPIEPNELALDAMLGDTQQLLAADLNRLYLSGFSGTAKLGWGFAAQLAGNVAGLIGVGGGLPPGAAGLGYPSLLENQSFSFFGAAGNTDFNYEEMVTLELLLDNLDIPHRFVTFEGPHSWLPAELAARAVDWLEVQAMKNGLRPVDPEFVNRLFVRWLEEGRELEAQGRPLAAAEAYRALVDDFLNLLPVERLTMAAARANELERSDEVKARLGKRREILEASREFDRKLRDHLVRFRESDRPVREAARMIDGLEVEELRRRAASAGDTVDALAAQRCLETIFVHGIFYLPRDFIETDPERALAALEVARAAKPESPRVCYEEARVHAAAGHTEEALDALECLVDTGAIRNPEFIEREPFLKRLAGEGRFVELMRRARERAAGETPPDGAD
ncbi:MAG: hypothetical protein JSV95_01865 [Gemmatimonadota bacterium]|jgi:predicted esterase|nr:MAG: hypothetical protein JSV95_01865 [Gemmatimonadota bacterium]